MQTREPHDGGVSGGMREGDTLAVYHLQRLQAALSKEAASHVGMRRALTARFESWGDRREPKPFVGGSTRAVAPCASLDCRASSPSRWVL